MRNCIIALVLIGAAFAIQPISSICPIMRADEVSPAAETDEQKAQALEADTITQLRLLSALYLREGVPDKAVECLEKICALQPDNVNALNDLIYLALHVRNYKAAEGAAQKLSAGKPDERNTLLALAACYYRLKNEQYKGFLEKADASEPAGNPYMDSAAHFEQFGMTELVYAELKKELDLPPSAPKNSVEARMAAMRKTAFYLSDEGKYAEAARMYGRLLAEMERAGLDASGEYNDAAAQMNYCEARQYERDGETDEARQKYETAVRLSPDNVDAQGHLYVLLKKQGKADDAKRVFEAAEAPLLARTADETDETAMNSLAWFYAVTGEKIDNGIKLARKAVASRPEEPAFLDTLAELYCKEVVSRGGTGSLKAAVKYERIAVAIPKRENVPYYMRQQAKMIATFTVYYVRPHPERVP